MPTCYRHPDRETGLSCSECGRPICVDCMTAAPVGIRCPEHSGVSSSPVARMGRTRTARRVGVPDTLVTRVLIALNVGVYLITVAQGGGLNNPGGSLFEKFALYGPLVQHGDWWRLITAAFLHGSILHIAFNMLALYWLGSPIEVALGKLRFILVYFASGLAGSAGALLFTPNSVTVGASGAIFGLLGAGFILEWRATGRFGGQYLMLIVINLAFTAVVPNISLGGHVGGLIGGIAGALVVLLANQIAYARRDLVAAAGLVAIGAISVAVAYMAV